MNLEADIRRRFDEMEERLTAAVSERMLQLARLREGMRVLDLASGQGEPALRAARHVGPRGRVLGIDVRDEALEVAREKARDAGLSHVEFRTLDAEKVDAVARGFDVVTSRWGLTYMQSPVVAFAAARRALRPGAQAVVALWAERERLPWWDVPRRVTERFAALPPVDPAGPCPFHYASVERIEQDFSAAGFVVEHLEELETAVVETETVAELLLWIRTLFRHWTERVPAEAAVRWEEAIEKEAERLRHETKFQLGGVTRVVVARTT